MNPENIVTACGLTKRFGDLAAVDRIDFTIAPGECFGMLGPNGAGKTTTVRMTYCVTPPTSGSLQVFGMDVTRDARRIKALLGVCPQEVNLDPDFSVKKNLQVYARYFGMNRSDTRTRVDDLLRFAELEARSGEKVDNLSGGMKRRLLLARALVNRPRLLILDEPTTGLDPQARHMIWDRIRDLKRQGVTIILTTHYMEEAEYLCDRLMFIDHGRIIETGKPRDLIATHAGPEVLEMWDLTEETRRKMSDLPFELEFSGTRAFLYHGDIQAMVSAIPGLGDAVPYMVRPTNLEDVFLKLTGRGLRE